MLKKLVLIVWEKSFWCKYFTEKKNCLPTALHLFGLGYHKTGAVEGQRKGLCPLVNTDRLMTVIPST